MYIYDPNEAWSPLARIDHLREDWAGEIYWFSSDLNGAPLEVTDEEGSLRWSGHYGSFGEVRHQTDGFTRLAQHTVLAHQPLRYADSETGLHDNLFRYYDPQSGRFTVQDPIGLSGGLNLYTYAPNPLKYIDLPGLCKTGAEDKNPYGTYRPARPLPRDKNGNPVADVDTLHTQLGTKSARKEDYTQAREWGYDENGNLVPKRDIDFTNHGRPNEHPNSHQHDYIPDPTGGTPQHGPAKDLEMP